MRVQDGKTGRWYQVLDRGGAEGNWLETSASCLFACAMAKAMRLKMIPPFCQEALVKAYGGVLVTVVWDEKKERIFLQHICTGTCVGDFDYYVNRKTAVNDLHGMGAFVLMCAEYALWRRETAQ